MSIKDLLNSGRPWDDVASIDEWVPKSLILMGDGGGDGDGGRFCNVLIPLLWILK
jgi:hypothetical protein